jgi:hypothetical protein
MKTWHYIAGAVALAVIGFVAFGGKKKINMEEWLAYAKTKTWQARRSETGVISAVRHGKDQSLSVNADGTVNINSGYRGVLVDNNTIITSERNGRPDGEIVWSVID